MPRLGGDPLPLRAVERLGSRPGRLRGLLAGAGERRLGVALLLDLGAHVLVRCTLPPPRPPRPPPVLVRGPRAPGPPPRPRAPPCPGARGSPGVRAPSPIRRRVRPRPRRGGGEAARHAAGVRDQDDAPPHPPPLSFAPAEPLR